MTAVITHLMVRWIENPDHFSDAVANAVASARLASSGVQESAIVKQLRQTRADFSDETMRVHSEHLTAKDTARALAGDQTPEQKQWLNDERQFWATHPMQGHGERYPAGHARASAETAPARAIEPAPTPAAPANSPPPDDSDDEMW